MGLFSKLFGTTDGRREAMRGSYEKHVRLAKEKNIDSPHIIGLYGALGTRYIARGMNVPEIVLWGELAPFLAMKNGEAIEALAEYIVYQEQPEDARKSWLRKVINKAILAPENSHASGMAYSGLANNVSWCNLLNDESIDALRRQINDE